MSFGIVNLQLQHRRGFVEAVDSGRRREYMRQLTQLMRALETSQSLGAAGDAVADATSAIGSTSSSELLTVTDGQSYSAGTFTLASVAAAEVISVNGVRFYAVSGTPVTGVNEFKRGVSDTADAASFVTTFNASTDVAIAGVLTASSALGVVTLTPTLAGNTGNGVTIENLGVMARVVYTASSTSGTLTCTINGVAITGTAGASDAASATVMAAAINASANALIKNHVVAYANASTVVVTAKYPGLRGNAITSTASGTGWTAGAARLAGGAIAQHEGVQASGTVTIASGSGTITATINGVGIAITWASTDANSGVLLSAAINSSTNALVRGLVTAADDGAGVVTITAVRGGISGNTITLAASGTGATASGARLTSGAVPTHTTLGSAILAASGFPGGRLSGGAQNTPVTFAQ